jgi:tetratricopeptide (TPR) repeat protein
MKPHLFLQNSPRSFRFSCYLLLFAILSPLSLSNSVQQQEDAGRFRTWTDASGKYSIKAELLKSEDGVVELKKEDGTTVVLPLEKLSDADRAYALANATKPAGERSSAPKDDTTQSEPDLPEASDSKPKTLSQLRASEQRLLYAKKIIEAYREYLAHPEILERERSVVNRRIAELEPEAARDALMIGKKFFLIEEIEAFKKESADEIDKFLSNPGSMTPLEVRGLLKGISRKDPVSCRANYLLAMGFAQSVREYDAALAEFKECARRLDSFGQLAVADPELAMAAVWNNIAIIQVRMGNLDSALKAWEAASKKSGKLPDVSLQNFIHQVVHMNIAIASDGKLFFNSPDPAMQRRYEKLGEKLGVTSELLQMHKQHGWQYVNLNFADSDDDLRKLKIELADLACLNCGGTSFKACPACGGDGTVKGKVAEGKRLLTGDIQIIETSVKEKCGVCDRGRIPCAACSNGLEDLDR